MAGVMIKNYYYKICSNKSLKSSKSVNPLDEKSLLEESFISKSIDNTRSISLSNNNSMESNLLSQLQEENLIIDDCKNLSLDEDDTSILNRGILKDSKDDSFDLNEQNEVSSPSMLFGPSFSLSRISENTESLDEPIDSAPRFHTVKEKSSGRRSSLSIFGITTHRRGKSEDNTCSLLKDDNDILINCGNDDGEVFLSSNNPLESVENVSIRERSKNNRDPIVSSRDNKCKSQFLLPDTIGIQNLSKSNNNLSDFNETNELNVAKILETSYDDQDIPQSYPSTSAPTSSKNSKKEKNNIKKNNDNQISFLENRLTKKYESLKDFNLTDKEKELEEKLTSTIAKGKGNDKGSKSILGSLFGGKKKTPKPSIQGIFPNPNGLGSKAISEAAFASINQNCNVIVGDSTKKSSTLPTDIKKVESQVSFTTTTDPIMGKFYERDRYL
uniref:Uncharacterized protein n=1 Tax=Parastrongyloides trichosuri TaxID=131310 RepID=A0A0N4Z2L3_PARTI